MSKRALVLRLCFFLVSCGAALPLARAADERPNIVFLLVDDMRWDDLGSTGPAFLKTPHMDRIGREGAAFRNAFATTPLCSPSRATFLTGVYPHTHGIKDNTERSAQSHRLDTFPQRLQAGGYETAFVGKWHMGNDSSARPGFDYWVCLEGQGASRDPAVNVGGKTVHEQGYVTDILQRRAMEFLRRPHAKPYLLYFAHKAMHPELAQRADGSISDPAASTFLPAERHRDLYAGVSIPRRPSATVPPRDKPALARTIAGVPPLGPETGSSDEAVLGRLRMLASVDESLGEIRRFLEESGQLDRTLIVVTSDHGYFYGEHGLSVERRLAYEESIRIPLLMRLPSRIRPGVQPAQLVLSLDLAPTLLELGGVALPPDRLGRSLWPLLGGKVPTDGWRTEFFIEYFSDRVFPRMDRMGYQAIRTERWKLIHYTELPDMDELYDLSADPYEMKNLASERGARETLAEMRGRLVQLRRATEGR